MNLHKTIGTILVACFLLLGLSACEKEGPAEKAGKAFDEAASSAAEQAEETKEAVEEKMKDD